MEGVIIWKASFSLYHLYERPSPMTLKDPHEICAIDSREPSLPCSDVIRQALRVFLRLLSLSYFVNHLETIIPNLDLYYNAISTSPHPSPHPLLQS